MGRLEKTNTAVVSLIILLFLLRLYFDISRVVYSTVVVLWLFTFEAGSYFEQSQNLLKDRKKY